MNVTLLILQKIKNMLAAVQPDPDKHLLSLATLPQPFDVGDFAFLSPANDGTAEQATNRTREAHEFAVLANSLPAAPALWDVDDNRLLYGLYQDILNRAEVNTADAQFVTRWQRARADLDPSRHRTNGDVPFMETTCLPNDLYQPDSGEWTRCRLTMAELTALDAQARQQFAPALYDEWHTLTAESDLDVTSVSFEYVIVRIIRSWFDESLLTSRHWRFPAQDNRFLSMGLNAFAGDLPAYPVQFVLIRNLELGIVPDSERNRPALQKLQQGQLMLGTLAIDSVPLNVNLNQVKTLKAATLQTNDLRFLSKSLANAQATVPAATAAPVETMMTLDRSALGRVDRMKMAPGLADARLFQVGGPRSVERVDARSVRDARRVVQPSDTFMPDRFEKPILRDQADWFRKWRLGKRWERQEPTPVPQVTLSGRITDAQTNGPLVGATVALLSGQVGSLSVQTDATGQFRFPPQPAGPYKLTVRADGYAPAEQAFDTATQQTFAFALARAVPPPVPFYLLAVVSRRLPRLPDPVAGGAFL